jgi:hypothetical protein
MIAGRGETASSIANPLDGACSVSRHRSRSWAMTAKIAPVRSQDRGWRLSGDLKRLRRGVAVQLIAGKV